MKIALPDYSGYIFQHFGRSEEFRLYEIDDADHRILSARTVSAEGRTHGQLAGWLREQGVDVVICGGIGDGMQQLLTSCGIRFYGGTAGDCDKNVAAFLAGNLHYNVTNEAILAAAGQNAARSDGEDDAGQLPTSPLEAYHDADGKLHMPLLF